MKLDHNKITSQTTAWVCDLYYRDVSNKPIRDIPPTKVLITPDDNHWSGFVINKLGKHNIVLKKTIQIYPNITQWKSHPINIFDNEQECINCYKEFCKETLDDFEQYLNRLNQKVQKYKNFYDTH